MLFPPEQLQLILQLTNNELAMVRKSYTMAGEIVKFFGVLLLVTWFEFGSQASLWSITSTNKYIPAPSFGLTGMPLMTCGCASGLVINHAIIHLRCHQSSTTGDLLMILSKILMNTKRKIFSHRMRFALTSPCLGGMGKVAIGSTMACQCMLRSTGNQKMAVRSRMLPVGILE